MIVWRGTIQESKAKYKEFDLCLKKMNVGFLCSATKGSYAIMTVKPTLEQARIFIENHVKEKSLFDEFIKKDIPF